jgi:hypothetical protein
MNLADGKYFGCCKLKLSPLGTACNCWMTLAAPRRWWNPIVYSLSRLAQELQNYAAHIQRSSIADCFQLAHRIGYIQFQHCPKETNKVMHNLARLAYELNNVVVWDGGPPPPC